MNWIGRSLSRLEDSSLLPATPQRIREQLRRAGVATYG